MKLATLTTSASKRLIGKAAAGHPAVVSALNKGIVAIIAGTTNSYAAREILQATGQCEAFRHEEFFRGITLPPCGIKKAQAEASDAGGFPGDVIIINGKWHKGKTIFDAADDMREGDVILKGANSLSISKKRAAVLVGHQEGGTITTALRAVIGRRVRLIIPIGLEKRISGDLDEIASRINSPGVKGPRLLPINGEVISEIEAFSILSGAKAELFAAGGVCGAEGSIWLSLSGTEEEERLAEEIYVSVKDEPPFSMEGNPGA